MGQPEISGFLPSARDAGHGCIEIPVICAMPPSPEVLEKIEPFARGYAAAVLGAVAQGAESGNWPEGMSYFLLGRALRRVVGSKNLEEVLRGFNWKPE